ncbi:unnamed protein product [Orchesella dallaii]|uniref:Uncharacterized protein n=1 Tax=Orchesella dallaii TaxID=48710 RepID=A0ABP1S054_9HEXA
MILKTFWGIGVTLILSSISPCLGGELRFCYKGPQRILFSDCPGGFIIKGPVMPATCLYYYKAENTPNMVAEYNRDICHADGPFELESDYHDWTSGDSFHYIRFVDVDTGGGPQIGADANLEKCNFTCLGDWIDNRWNEPEEVIQDKPVLTDAALIEQYKMDYLKITKSIMIKIIQEDEFEEDVNEIGESIPSRHDLLGTEIAQSQMTGLMKILAMSMRILFLKCHPFVEGSFYTLVLRSMIELRNRGSTFPNLDVVVVERLLRLLDTCEKDTNEKFLLNGTECEDKFVVNSITNQVTGETKNYHGGENSFRWSVYDPIVEAAWDAVDFVHGYCAEHFMKDLLHYSLYVKVMDEIFVQPVTKKHWMYPTVPVGSGMNVWEMAYDTADIKNQLRNMDACVSAAYVATPCFNKRLERPFTPQEIVETPVMVPNPETPKQGWEHSVDDYWKMYARRGFKDFTEKFGYCLKSTEEFDEVERSMRQNCP